VQEDRTVRRALLAVSVLALLPAFARDPVQDAPLTEAPPTATCVFTNPAYSGSCVETADLVSGATAQQACESILRCLNDVGCPKTYCRATEIRSGWRLESATAK
jgi:hypothetical protein